MTQRAEGVHHDQADDQPGQRKRDHAQADTVPPLKYDDRETDHDDVDRNLLFGRECQHASDNQSHIVACQHEVEGEHQKRYSQRHRVEIEDLGRLLRRKEQVGESESHSGKRALKTTAGHPVDGEGPTAHDQGLQKHERLGRGRDDIESEMGSISGSK